MASSSTPRSRATRRAVVSRFRPSIVARTMLCGLVEPRLLVRMSRMPAHSSTARPRRLPDRADRAGAGVPGPAPVPPQRPLGLAGRTEPQELGRSRSSGLPGSLDPLPLELQSPFAGAIGHSLHAPVILITAAVEHDLGDALLLGLGGDELPDGKAPRHLALALDLHTFGRVRRAGERETALVIDELGVDVLGRAEHDQPGPLRRARDLLADAEVPAIPLVRRRLDLPNGSHGLFRRLGRLARFAPDLLARVADAFALVWLGWADIAQLRGHLAHEFLVDTLDLHVDVIRHRNLDALRRVIGHGMRVPDHQLHAERLRLGLVADALDLERLREARGDALDHVGDERAREAMQRLVLRLVRRTLHDHAAVLERQQHVRVQRAADLALRPLHRDLVPVDLRGDAFGQRHGLPADP